MNKFLKKVAKLTLGLAMAIGSVVGASFIRNDKHELLATSGDELTFDASSSIDADFDTAWHYAFTKGANGNAPAAYANGIRVYNAKGTNKYGGHLTLSPNDSNTTGYITSVVITATGTSNAPTIKIKAGATSSAMSSATESSLDDTSAVYTYTLSNTTTRYIEFTNWGNNAGSYVQWIVKKLQINYTIPGGGSDPVSVTGVTLNKNSTSIDVGATDTLTATVSPSDATDKSVTWKSYSDSSCTTESSAVASVSSAGVVTGVSAGTAYVQVKTTDGNFTAKCTVTVVTPTWTDILDLDGKTAYVKTESGNYYLPNDITTSYVHPGYATSTTNAQAFDFTLVANNTYTIQAHGGTYNGYYLSANNSNGSSHKMFYHQTTPHNWTGSQVSGSFLLQDANGRYLTLQGTTDWRGYGTRQSNQRDTLVFPIASTDPAITNVSLTGGPATSTVGGGSTFKVTATVTAVNDTSETLSRDVNWTVSPSGAVTFSKTTSVSGEEITVTAVNTANDDVVITASSAATGFTTVHADLTAFDIIKSYVVNTVTLSATTAGGPTYDASCASSFVVGFTTAVNYTGDSGTGKVNITVSPTTGVSGYGDNVTAGNFNLTFTKSGTYSVTSTSVENNTKYQTVSITVNNIVVPGYELITSGANLREGSKIIIRSSYVSSDTTYNRVMTTTQNTNNRGYTNYAVSNDFIPQTDVTSNDIEVLTLVSSGDGYWYLKTLDDKYLWAEEQSANKNYLRSESETSENTKFTISFSNGVPSIVPKVDTSRKIQHNHGNSCFSCYTGTQFDISLYLWVDTSPYFTISDTSAYVGVRGTHTLTVTAHNGANANVAWTTSNSDKVSIPNNSTGTSVVVTGVAEGTSTITAAFTPLDGHSYVNLTCLVTVVEIDDFVNIGVTTFTKVTSEPTGGWEGTYLIVDETAEKCFDGSVSPLLGDSTKDVDINDGSITATASMISSSFNIKESENSGYYNVRSNSGYYIGGSDKSININIGEAYDLTISSAGVITGTGSATLRYVSTGGYFRFYVNETGDALSLYKADGERRAISDTIVDWYDAAKSYLTCDMGGTDSTIDWDSLYESAIEMLVSNDYDTIKRMSAKSGEDNGNYLEDFISDYDYLVQFKGYTDFFDRFAEGGAMHGMPIVKQMSLFNTKTTNTVAIIVIISMVSVTTIGGYFFLRRRKED